MIESLLLFSKDQYRRVELIPKNRDNFTKSSSVFYGFANGLS